jgi:CRP-like cAMP-binding protein
MATLTNHDLIRRVPLFASLTPAQVEALALEVAKRRFKRNEAIVEDGTKSDALFIILSGRARVVMTNDKGKEVILATLRVGDCVGEMSLIDNQPHSANVIADVQVDALMLTRDGFTKCVLSNAATAVAVMRGLVSRLRKANQQVASFALMSVYSRVARVLLESAVPNRLGELLIEEKISHLNIAKMVGASREMVSRAMKDFETQSFVQKLDNGSLRVNERRKRTRA